VVATATLAAIVGWGGLGRYIYDGYRVQDDQRIFAGALLVALLAIAVEGVLAGVQRIVVPKGLRVAARAGAGGSRRPRSANPGLAPGAAVEPEPVAPT
jgi:osmoprotectant transport system permease protein